MSNDPSSFEEGVFAGALALPPSEWPAFVRRACSGDAELCARVEALLRGHAMRESAFDNPAPAAVAGVGRALQAEAAAHVESERIGRYRLLEKIGEGGFGVVWLAEQREPVKRLVALKIIRPGMDSKEVIARFEVERQALALMDHPNIAKVLDAGTTETGRPFFVMELVRGVSITKYCDSENLPTRARLELFTQVCHAVQHAHQKGIIHRDIKPSNILVTLRDGVATPKVIDFGIAKATAGRLTDNTVFTAFEQFMGTPAYMSPEQAELSPLDIDTRTDIYSLGILLYELLTGRPPFDPKSLASAGVLEIRRVIREVEPPWPSTRLNTLNELDRATIAKQRSIAPGQLSTLLRRDLDWIVMRCLEKDRARRYATANALAIDVLRHLHDEPVVARPPSVSYRVQKMVRRHRLAFVATTAVAVALVGGIVVSRLQAVRANAARDAAEESLYAHAMQVLSRGLTSATGFGPNATGTLEQFRPKPGHRDLRGFEWRYFWLRSQSNALATLSGHQHVVDAVFFSPDRTLMATHSGENDGTLKIWEATTNKLLLSHDHVAVAAGFDATGTHFIFSLRDHSIWRLDLRSHQAVRASEAGGKLISIHPDNVHAVIFGSDQRPVLHRLDEPTKPVRSRDVPRTTKAAVSADGRRAAVWALDQPGILVIDLTTRREITRLPDPRIWVTGIALSPDGRRLVSSGMDSHLKVWDVDYGTEEHSFRGFLDYAHALAFAPDGKSFAAGGNNRFLKIWNTATWQETEKLIGHTSTVKCLTFSSDGQRLLSGGEDELALVWPAHGARLKTEMPQLLRGPEWLDRTAAIAFSPDSEIFAGTAADGTVKVWRTATTDVIATMPVDARNLAFSSDGKSLLTETNDGHVQRWTLGGEVLGRAGKPNAPFASWLIAPLTSQERVALVASQAETRAQCRLCEVSSARDAFVNGAGGAARTIATDGRTIVIGLPSGEVEIWEVEAPKQRMTLTAHKLAITGIAISRDGKYFATGSLDNSTKLWETATGRHVKSFGIHNRPVWAVAFSPDGQTLAAGSCDKEISLYSVPLRQHVAGLQTYTGAPQGFEQEVRSLRFSPDGNILAAGLGDGTLRFFRAAPFSETDRDPN